MNPSAENLLGPESEPSPPDSQSVARNGSVFEGGGVMGALMRAFNWSQTAVGPPDAWPQSLRTAVGIILTSRYAMFVWRGRELVNLYNDPTGSKHPAALGKSARYVWARSGIPSALVLALRDGIHFGAAQRACTLLAQRIERHETEL
jgi:hypothetical protein